MTEQDICSLVEEGKCLVCFSKATGHYGMMPVCFDCYDDKSKALLEAYYEYIKAFPEEDE